MLENLESAAKLKGEPYRNFEIVTMYDISPWPAQAATLSLLENKLEPVIGVQFSTETLNTALHLLHKQSSEELVKEHRSAVFSPQCAQQ